MQKFIAFFGKGFYRWRKLYFGLVGEDVVIVRAVLHLNYNKDYIYNIEDDPENDGLDKALYRAIFEDYNLEERVENDE